MFAVILMIVLQTSCHLLIKNDFVQFWQ